MAKHKRGYKNNRMLVALIAVLLVCASFLGGAMAWTDFTQYATNKFHGSSSSDADVTLHDEFDGVNKDVFVENSGQSTIYVRVRMDEYMQVGELVFDAESDVKDRNSWLPHTFTGESIADCGNAREDKFHDYFVWDLSGEERDYKPGTPGMVYGTLGDDDKVDATGPNHTAAKAAPVLLSTALELIDKALAEETLSAQEQLTYDAVLAGCWLLDDTAEPEDGGAWAYWSHALAPGAATNLLLDSVTMNQAPSDDWIYRIDVKLQAVTRSDYSRWNNAAEFGYRLSGGAVSLITKLWNGSVEISEQTSAATTAAATESSTTEITTTAAEG
jgi:hypothetical protein